jgi:hypothetical protein
MTAINQVLTLSVLTIVGMGDADGAMAAQNLNAPFSLNLKAPVGKVKLGTPVQVTITLKNISEHDVSIWRENATDQGGYVYRVDIRDKKGTKPPDTKMGKGFKGLDDPAQATRDTPTERSGGWIKLKAGEARTEDVNVSKLYDLDQPGKYAIRFRHFDEETKAFVKSNTITVTVTP